MGVSVEGDVDVDQAPPAPVKTSPIKALAAWLAGLLQVRQLAVAATRVG